MNTRTKLEIIDETVNFYSADPKGRRAVSADGTCEYASLDGKQCAVGRCMGTGADFNYLGTVSTYAKEKGVGVFQSHLRPEYRGHSLLFWVSLQRLHDYNENWCHSGLTDIGQVQANRLKRSFSDTE